MKAVLIAVLVVLLILCLAYLVWACCFGYRLFKAFPVERKTARENELKEWQVSSEEDLCAKIHAIQKEARPSELQKPPAFGQPVWSGAVKHYRIKARCKANSTRRRYSLSTLTPARRGTTL